VCEHHRKENDSGKNTASDENGRANSKITVSAHGGDQLIHAYLSRNPFVSKMRGNAITRLITYGFGWGAALPRRMSI